ncbi:hypothetical protein CY34DRAFT_17917 [Suillus luteus UH-Slu-Lm8-n1]|uniref:Uncharacterized protein n=1 Tax=Suillus luteus UH-Slu-Lm8-n1 TaxID=930992 RepID=A0A0D0AQ97_9AGAM|nr:hypothetical protein CY34DRAFT_17917 [Suillus luteus UH-Slu-Lm8-n1]
MPSTSTLPHSKSTADCRKRYNPYMRPSHHIGVSRRAGVAPVTAPLTREFAMYFKGYEVRLEQDALSQVWMGSAMKVDEPDSLGESSGSAQVVDVPVPITSLDATNFGLTVFPAPISANLGIDTSSNQAGGHVSLKKGKLIRGVQKTIIKYVERHCKVGHPTTDLVCERINTVLEGVLLGMEMDDIIVPRRDSKGGKNHETRGHKQDVRR